MAISENIVLSTPFKQPHDQRDLSLNLHHFRKFKVALNPLHGIFFNFAKTCILSCLSQFDNKRWGSLSSFLSYKSLKCKLRVFLAGHIVAMVICYIKRMTATCLPMIGHLVCYYYCIIAC